MQSRTPFRIVYDAQTDMLAFVLASPPYHASGTEMEPDLGMVVHTTGSGQITEIEVEHASKRLDLDFLRTSPAFETVFDPHDVQRIRDATGLSENDLADRLGVSVRTLRHWLHGTRSPKGSARRLLETFRDHPEVLR